MKHIVMLHPAYWEQKFGGAELQLRMHYLAFKNAGYEIFYIYIDTGVKVKNIDDINLLPIRKGKIDKKLGKAWFLYNIQIYKLLQIVKPQIIYTRYFTSWNYIASIYERKNNAKYFWAVACDNEVVPIDLKFHFCKPFEIIENLFIKKAFSLTSRFLTQNEFQTKMLINIHKKKPIKLNQSTYFFPVEKIKKDSDEIHVLWIGNLKPIKHPERFLEIVERFKNYKNYSFIMVGRPDGYYSEMINNKIKSLRNLKYLGELTNEEVNDLLAKSHILVNTSDIEGFSNTFVQAWMRKVVVISMYSNPDELLTKLRIGFVTNEIKEICSIITHLSENRELLVEMQNKAYEYVVDHHCFEKNIEKLIKLFQTDNYRNI